MAGGKWLVGDASGLFLCLPAYFLVEILPISTGRCARPLQIRNSIRDGQGGVALAASSRSECRKNSEKGGKDATTNKREFASLDLHSVRACGTNLVSLL